MSVHYLLSYLNRNIYLLTITKYPWLNNVPKRWPFIVQYLYEYTPILVTKIITLIAPNRGLFKCNSDGACRANPRPMSSAFCVRNDIGEFVYSDIRTTWDILVTEVEVIAMRMGIEFCVAQSFLPITLETDSLALKNIVDRVWEVPWTISMEVKKISSLREKVLKLVEVTHILRERNKVTVYFFANIVFSFAGTNHVKYTNIE